MTIFVTGCAGFVGSNLLKRLSKEGYSVVGIDNFSTGKRCFLDDVLTDENISVYTCDILKEPTIMQSLMKGCSIVFHLSANADVRHGTEDVTKDTLQNFVATQHVLEAMRTNKIKRIVFSSTGSVYGETNVIPTPEDAPFPVQTSLYGASKLAAEGLIQAYCEAFDMQSYIFRFVSLLGNNYSHGHVKDFVGSLLKNKLEINILGNGKQMKSYLHVDDCISGMLVGITNAHEKVNIFNLGNDYAISVLQSLAIICETLNFTPIGRTEENSRGWIGDIPTILLDCTKIRSLGWKPVYTIEQSVKQTVQYLLENKWLLK